MHAELRQKAIELRTKERLSYGAILRRVPVSKSTLSKWLRHYSLTEEEILELRRKGWQKGEASRERFRATMRRRAELKDKEAYERNFKKMKELSPDAFWVSGLMLYLAEGGKTSRYTIVLANTNPDIIKFFIKWLYRYLHISRKKLRAELHLYENMDIEKEVNFWKNELGLKAEQLYKPQIRKLKAGSFSYAESFRHGTCGIYFTSVEKKRELMMAAQSFLDYYQFKLGV